MLRLDLKVVGNHMMLDVTIAAHAMRVRATMLSLASFLKISYVFKSQDMHNASYYIKMSWRDLRQSNGKFNENIYEREIMPKKM